MKVPHARLEVAGTRASGEQRGERPCGFLMGRLKARFGNRGSFSEWENLEQQKFEMAIHPVALCSPRLRLKSPEEIGLK